jgi:hypothetical protein
MSHSDVNPPNCQRTTVPMSASTDFDNARSGSCDTNVNCATVPSEASRRTESISCATDAVRSVPISDRSPEPRNGIANPESGWRRCGFGSGYTLSSPPVPSVKSGLPLFVPLSTPEPSSCGDTQPT